MLISTRGRYALRVMLDLSLCNTKEYTPMKAVAERQELSLKYLERILPVLSKNRLIEGMHGKGGGYRLSRSPGEYTVGEILRLTEGNLAPVSCLECTEKACKKADTCLTLPMWTEFHGMINDYFDKITLEDLLNGKKFYNLSKKY